MQFPLKMLVFLPSLALLMTALGCGGSSMGTPPTSSQKAPTISLSAQPATVTSGTSATLKWKTTNAASVTISGLGSFAADGSATVKPAVTTTYTATASGPGGKANAATLITVTPSGQQPAQPTISFSAQPASIPTGASATLSWTTTNASSVSIQGLGTFAASGSTMVTPDTTTTYSASAQGADNSAHAVATVLVTPPAVPLASHVFLVMEENHSYSSVIGNSSMPYFNSLANQYGLATQYFANTHPSIGNYFELTTGQIITNNDGYKGTVSADNVVRHLLTAGKTWKSYAENLPSVGYIGGDVYPYCQHHNPFTYFTDVVNSQNQRNNLVPFTQFATDLKNNQLPEYTYIVPNMQDDAHDGSLAQADSWLKTNIAPLIASSTFQKNGLLVIVFDESFESDGLHGGGHVAMLVISPLAKKGYKSTTLYQHPSTCRVLMQGLGLTSFPASCQSATQMAEFF